MPLLQNIGGWISHLSPFRRQAAPVSVAQNANSRPQPYLRSHAFPPSSQQAYMTPSVREPRKRPRPLESESDDHPSSADGLLTPSTGDSSIEVPQGPDRKRQKITQTPIDTVERQQKQLPKSGATKAAVYFQKPLSPGEFKRSRDRRLAEVKRFRDNGWRDADVALFRKINLRGFEPLLPRHWNFDFPALPDSLFSKHIDGTSISPLGLNERHNGDFHASQTLWSLLDLGPKVRDDLLLGADPYRRIGKTFRDALKWSMDDANLLNKRGVLPLAVVCTAPSFISPDAIQIHLNDKLAELAEAWRKALGPRNKDKMPPLYGIAVSHAVWAILSYAPGGKSKAKNAQEDPDNFTTLLNTFSFMKPGQEVWVGFSFAIFATHCRDELLKVLDSGLVAAYDGTDKLMKLDEDL